MVTCCILIGTILSTEPQSLLPKAPHTLTPGWHTWLWANMASPDICSPILCSDQSNSQLSQFNTAGRYYWELNQIGHPPLGGIHLHREFRSVEMVDGRPPTKGEIRYFSQEREKSQRRDGALGHGNNLHASLVHHCHKGRFQIHNSDIDKVIQLFTNNCGSSSGHWIRGQLQRKKAWLWV